MDSVGTNLGVGVGVDIGVGPDPDAGVGVGVGVGVGAGGCFLGQITCVRQRMPSTATEPPMISPVSNCRCGHPKSLHAACAGDGGIETSNATAQIANSDRRTNVITASVLSKQRVQPFSGELRNPLSRHPPDLRLLRLQIVGFRP